MKSYLGRVAPKLQFTPMYVIDDSLRSTAEFIVQAACWAPNMVVDHGVCPFQFDFNLIFERMVSAEERAMDFGIEEDDSSDEDDDKDDSEQFESLGDIKRRLARSGVNYHSTTKRGLRNWVYPQRAINELYYNLLGRNHLSRFKSKDIERLQGRRTVVTVDRRRFPEPLESVDPNDHFRDGKYQPRVDRREEVNHFFMYDAPDECGVIPGNTISEWYFNSSRQCIIPKDSENGKDIGTQTACDAGILTASFHVKQEKVIKMYLYHNGGCIRFMPEDIKSVLPTLFNMKREDNVKFIESGEADRCIQRLQGLLVDNEFDAFQESYERWNNTE